MIALLVIVALARVVVVPSWGVVVPVVAMPVCSSLRTGVVVFIAASVEPFVVVHVGVVAVPVGILRGYQLETHSDGAVDSIVERGW